MYQNLRKVYIGNENMDTNGKLESLVAQDIKEQDVQYVQIKRFYKDLTTLKHCNRF